MLKKKLDAVIENRRTMNRKALRLVVQLVTISKDQSWAINTVLVGFRVMSAGMSTCNFLNVLAHSTVYHVQNG